MGVGRPGVSRRCHAIHAPLDSDSERHWAQVVAGPCWEGERKLLNFQLCFERGESEYRDRDRDRDRDADW